MNRRSFLIGLFGSAAVAAASGNRPARPPGSRHQASIRAATARQYVRPPLASAGGSTAFMTVPVHADLRRRA